MMDEKKQIIAGLIGVACLLLVVVLLMIRDHGRTRDEEIRTVHLIQQAFWAGYSTRMRGIHPQDISSQLFNAKSVAQSRTILEVYSGFINAEKMPKNER